MPLKRINADIKEKPKSKSEILESAVPAPLQGKVARYNEQAAKLKEVEAEVKGLRVEIVSAALPVLVSHNVENATCVASVNLVEESGESLRLTSQNKYSTVDADAVCSVFDQFNAGKRRNDPTYRDVNNYVVETLKASFDSAVFLDASSNFSQERYDAFKAAVEMVAQRFNVPSPFSVKRVVTPKPDFNERRYKDFSAEQNAALSQVLPNTVTLTPAKAE